MDKLLEEISKNIFSPNGTDLYLYPSDNQYIKNTYNHESGRLNEIIRTNKIRIWNKGPLNSASSLYKKCMSRTGKSLPNRIKYDGSRDPEDFVYDFLDGIYNLYNEGENPLSSKDDVELREQRRFISNLDSRQTSLKSELVEDTRLYNALYALLNKEEEHRFLINYVKLKSTDKDEFDKLESESGKYNFINHTFFKDAEKSSILELYCQANEIRYTTSKNNVYLHQCVDCNQIFSSMLYESCPNCNSHRFIPIEVLNRPYVRSCRKINEKLIPIVENLKAKNEVDIDEVVNKLSSTQQAFYDEFYRNIIDELNSRLDDEYIHPLEDLESFIRNSDYDAERHKEALDLNDKFKNLTSQSDLLKLHKNDFESRLKNVLRLFEEKINMQIAAGYEHEIEETLSSNPDRLKLKVLKDKLFSLDQKVLDIIISKKLIVRIETYLLEYNKAEAQNCIQSLKTNMENCDFRRLSVAESLYNDSVSYVDSLHQDSYREFVKLGGKELIEKFGKDLKYHKDRLKIKPLTDSIDACDTVLPNLAEFDIIRRNLEKTLMDPDFSKILEDLGYISKTEALLQKIIESETSETEKYICKNLRLVDDPESDDSRSIVEMIDRYITALDARVISKLKESSVFSDYINKKRHVLSKINHAKAKEFDDRLHFVENETDSSVFVNCYDDLIDRKNGLDGDVIEIVRNEFDLENRFKELSKRYEDALIDIKSDEIIAGIQKFKTNFIETNTTTAENLEKQMDTKDSGLKIAILKKTDSIGISHLGILFESKYEADRLFAQIDDVLSRTFDKETCTHICKLEQSISSLDPEYREKFITSAKYRKYQKYVTEYGQWQYIHIVQPIYNDISSIKRGRMDFDKGMDHIRELRQSLLPVYDKMIENDTDLSSIEDYRNLRTGNPEVLEELTKKCETNFSKDGFDRFNECYNKLPKKMREDDTVANMQTRLKNAGSAHWQEVSDRIETTVKKNSGFLKKFSADDVEDIRFAWKQYLEMPDEFRKRLNPKVELKLKKLYDKIRK